VSRSQDPVPPPRISRRDFLALSGVSALVAAACAPIRLRAGEEPPRFDREVEVVVVGTGAAGATAAVFAHEGGASVLVLEKARVFGGTTAKSGGVYWIPGSHLERAQGLVEPPERTLRKLAQACYPLRFDAAKEGWNLPARELSLLEALVAQGPAAVLALERVGAVRSMSAQAMVGAMPEYYEEPDGGRIVDRRLQAMRPDGSFGLGDELVRQLRAALDARGVEILLGHAARRLVLDASGAVVGLEAHTPEGECLAIRARRGVVFASGGFTHAPELVLHYQPGPVYGGCAVPTNQGDFVHIAQAAGAQLGHMHRAWRSQIVLEQALHFSSVPDVIFMPPGDSMLLVNRFGRRVVNEKACYHDRAEIHFTWDENRKEWIHRILVMVYDQRTAELYGGNYPIPQAGTLAPWVISAPSWELLAVRVGERLERLAARTGELRLDPGFAAELARSVRRFDAGAARGEDPDFRRGERAYDRYWHLQGYSEPNPSELARHPLHPKNPTLHPFRSEGPYHAILVAGGTLDTNGGPVIDAQARVLHAGNAPIPGLFGAGNCVAAPMPYYYAGGGTIASAITFGFIAGSQAARAPERRLG
jgi:succinate dehydrogenase/fumarate reductase flavoprotein subunit